MRTLKTDPKSRIPKSVYINEVQKIESIVRKYSKDDQLEDWSKYTKAKLDDYAKRLYMYMQSVPLVEKLNVGSKTI